MKRSKILVVLALMVVASLMAAVGTGAIDVFKADRAAGISVVNDASGYLGIKADSSYAKVNANGTMALDFTSTNNNVIGDGFNAQAFTQVDDVFSITNQSATPLYVWFESDNWNSWHNAGLRYYINQTNGDITRVDDWYYQSDEGKALLNSIGMNFVNGVGRDAYVKLDPGEYFNVKITANTVLANGYGDAGKDWSHKLTIKANKTAPTQPGQYHQ